MSDPYNVSRAAAWKRSAEPALLSKQAVQLLTRHIVLSLSLNHNKSKSCWLGILFSFWTQCHTLRPLWWVIQQNPTGGIFVRSYSQNQAVDVDSERGQNHDKVCDNLKPVHREICKILINLVNISFNSWPVLKYDNFHSLSILSNNAKLKRNPID